jgi:hypothetical protein
MESPASPAPPLQEVAETATEALSNHSILLGESTGFWIQTGVITLSAVIALATVVYTLRNSRKRATIDLVLHQSTNQALIDAKKKVGELHKRRAQMATYADDGQVDSDETKCILRLLNNYEFIASGIRDGAFDERIYKRMQHGVLVRDWNSLKPFIEQLRVSRDHDTLFQEFQWLGQRWKDNPLSKDSERWKVFRRFFSW